MQNQQDKEDGEENAKDLQNRNLHLEGKVNFGNLFLNLVSMSLNLW